MLVQASKPTILAPTDGRRVHKSDIIRGKLTKVEPDEMSEEEKLNEVVSRLNRLLAKQKYIEERMKKIEETVEDKAVEE